MNCDRCREQLPVGDGIDHQGQNLCLECYLRGAATITESEYLIGNGQLDGAVSKIFYLRNQRFR